MIEGFTIEELKEIAYVMETCASSRYEVDRPASAKMIQISEKALRIIEASEELDG